VLVAADPMRVGAREQLQAYAERLGADLKRADDAQALADVLGRCGRRDMVVIDTPGTNPYDLEELAYVIELAGAGDVEPILLLGAGRDAEEAADLAKAFRPVEATRLLATGLDLSHRLGSLLAAADSGRLAFADVSASPRIAQGLKPLNPLTLARLLLPDEEAETGFDVSGAQQDQAAGHADRGGTEGGEEPDADTAAAIRAARLEATPKFGPAYAREGAQDEDEGE
jgi:flagellar biosynthesis protein FlhF